MQGNTKHGIEFSLELGIEHFAVIDNLTRSWQLANIAWVHNTSADSTQKSLSKPLVETLSVSQRILLTLSYLNI